ncbi:MAG: hypothetical protein HHJ10_11370 [Cellulomonas sp.]|uniref:DUF7657 domain-containing protein n=1 Tax=Cellulomonas sp. TaxID=40001 RepID=UPI0017BA78E3|nr:hypothetical protein [Cellulomonas sp.]NMM31610.1 hypothetical protein [Cellulomonas sp.]
MTNSLDDPVGASSLQRALRRLRQSRWWVWGPVGLYLVLVLAGVTQSSIGADGLREDPAHPSGVMFNQAVSIRSDEYLTSTPLSIGATASGSTDTLNPLTAPQGFFTMLPTGLASSVVLFDGAILRLGTFLPDQMLIAARWWLPFLLLGLGAPMFFRSLTGSRWIGYFAAALMIFSPSSAWWSFSPLGMLGFTMAGSAALLRCAAELGEGRRRRAVIWGLVSAVLLARTPLHYQPWAIVIAPTILLAAIAGLVADKRRRRTNLIAVGATGAVSVLLLLGVLLENLESIRASLGTVYPGARVASGGPNPLQEIFGATNLGKLDAMAVTGTNPSEISSSYAVAAVLAVLVLAYGVRFRDRSHRAATVTAVALVGFWFTWSLVDFGTWGSRFPVINLVPPQRASDVLGYVAILLVCLVLPGLADRTRLGFALLAAGACALVAADAGSLLRSQNLLTLSVQSIWFSSVLLAIVVFVVAYRPRVWAGYVLGGVLAFSLVWHVNPVIFGLGDLRGSAISKTMLRQGEQARAAHTVWASDNIFVDTLMAATAVPSLSGRQLAGPERDVWAKLDPTLANEAVWNRGGSYIWFNWTDASDLKFSNPSPDAISISGSPCTVAQRMPALKEIVSSHKLGLSCLSEVDTFTWGQGARWVYAVSTPTP